MNLFLRKVWHLLGLVLPALYYFGLFSRTTTLFVLGAGTAFAVFLEVLRFNNKVVARVFAAAFRPLLREEEYRALNATIPYLIATFLVLLVFPKVIAWVALVYVALGDVAAHLVGGALGRVRIATRKTLEGTLACFGVCFAAGSLFVDWRLALAGAGAAAAAELLSRGWVDNFTMPVAAGAVMWFLSFVARINLPA